MIINLQSLQFLQKFFILILALCHTCILCPDTLRQSLRIRQIILLPLCGKCFQFLRRCLPQSDRPLHTVLGDHAQLIHDALRSRRSSKAGTGIEYAILQVALNSICLVCLNNAAVFLRKDVDIRLQLRHICFTFVLSLRNSLFQCSLYRIKNILKFLPFLYISVDSYLFKLFQSLLRGRKQLRCLCRILQHTFRT